MPQYVVYLERARHLANAGGRDSVPFLFDTFYVAGNEETTHFCCWIFEFLLCH